MLGCSTVYIALVTTNTERNQQSKFMCNTRFPDSSRISAALGSEQVTNTNLAPGLVDRCQWPLQSSWRVSVSIGVNSFELGLSFSMHAVNISISLNLLWAYTAAVTQLRTSRLSSGETLGRIMINYSNQITWFCRVKHCMVCF